INTIATLAYTKDSMSSSNNFIKDTLLMLLGNIPNIMKVMSLSGRLKKRHGLKKIDLMDVFISQENLNIVYTTKELQPNSQSFDDSFKFVGPTAVNRRSRETNFPFDRLDGKYVIYISLGTVFNNDVDFYYKCFEALKDMDICAVLSVGSNVDTGALKNIPANFIVMNYINIPQLEILKRCNLFITHGGMNSIHEGIYYELPLISIPQQLDQQLISEQVQKYGNGIYLKPSNVTAQSIRDSVRTIMEDESYKKNTIKIKESFISSGGYMRAADEILSFAGKKSGVKIS
ncbi:MAG TPA: nucleotide disphospho-sugar-binding domain-containing protein, partial [Ruminiclostridium sp.]|nr:nucleotide disphospho-sugar-binding domain-containing protein [Ruminiclostridium sp.]